MSRHQVSWRAPILRISSQEVHVTSRTRTALLLVILVARPAVAAPRPSTTTGSTVAWIAIGAGAGFGVGMLAGLKAFDDAVDGDRKAWTTAIACAAAGGGLAYLIQRARHRPTQTSASMTDEELRMLTVAGARRLDGALASLVNLEARPVRVVPPTRKWRNWQTR